MSNLVTRVLVALVGIPLLLFILTSGGWILALFTALICILGAKEFSVLSSAKGAHTQTISMIVMASAIPILLQLSISSGFTLISGVHQEGAIISAISNNSRISNYETLHSASLVYVTLLPLSILIVLTSELWRNKENALLNISTTIAGIWYVGGLLSSMVLLPIVSGSNFVLLSIFVAIWVCDSSAYFAGMAFGKHKIFPRVSPKKSWEGSIAGLILGTVAFYLMAMYWIPTLPQNHAIILGVLIAIVGQIGDFAESLLKRDSAIKDSSSLIPGHGGVLDRFDSILFAVPVVLLYWIIARL
jgi:phosphatidate cytidylyltransferase